MDRASPVDLRKSMVLADLLTKAGILFVPVPVNSKEEFDAKVMEVVQDLDKLADSLEKAENKS